MDKAHGSSGAQISSPFLETVVTMEEKAGLETVFRKGVRTVSPCPAHHWGHRGPWSMEDKVRGDFTPLQQGFIPPLSCSSRPPGASTTTQRELPTKSQTPPRFRTSNHPPEEGVIETRKRQVVSVVNGDCTGKGQEQPVRWPQHSVPKALPFPRDWVTFWRAMGLRLSTSVTTDE